MKGLLVVFLLMVAVVSPSFSQIDSAVTFNTYAGAFAANSYSSSGISTWGASLRIGAEGSLPVASGLSLNVRAGYETSPSWGNSVFGKFYLTEKTDLANVSAGFMPRPITFCMRPTPISADGQFEPPAIAMIPGCANGIMLERQEGSFDVKAGAYYVADQSVEWNASLSEKFSENVELRYALYASRIQQGVSAKLMLSDISVTYFFRSDSWSSALICWDTPIVSPFVNVIYDRPDHDTFNNLLIGWTKTVRLKNISCLVGMGYQAHTKTTNCYVEIYL